MVPYAVFVLRLLAVIINKYPINSKIGNFF